MKIGSYLPHLPAVLLLLSLASPLAAQVNVLTGQYDNSRSNANLSEPWLTTQSVNTTSFGKLFSLSVDGAIYAQPLYASNVSIPRVGLRNVLYVCTMHNSVYAFDADNPSQPAYWRVNLGTSVANVNQGTQNIYAEIGILSTPAIDPNTSTLYVAAHVMASNAMTVQLHALDLATAAEKFSGPVTLQASVAGTGDGSVSGAVSLVYTTSQGIVQIQRPALLLLNGSVYLGMGGYSGDLRPFHGWLLGYSASNLTVPTGVFNTTPNDYGGAIWQSGNGPAADSNGYIYVNTGNGGWDGAVNFGQSLLKFSSSGNSLSLVDWFTPADFATLNGYDLDLSAGGAHLFPFGIVFAGGKDGEAFLANTTALGHEASGNMQVLQAFQATQGQCGVIFCYQYPSPRITSVALWNRTSPSVYIWGGSDILRVFSLSGSGLNTTPVSVGTISSVFAGGNMAISANGGNSGTGILWATTAASSPNANAVPGTLRAINAENAAQELWNSDMNPGRDQLGVLAKYVAPVVANGKVYASTLSNQLPVYGLLCGSDLTGMVSVTRSGFRYNAANGHFLQTVTVTNTSGVALAGPITIAIQSLSTNATLSNASGTTTCGSSGAYVAIPLASPYLAAGQPASVILDFVNPSRAAIGYSPAVARGGLYQ